MKRVFAVLLAFAMLVSFASCGAGDDAQKTESVENKQRLNSYVVEDYVPIEATNTEGKIIAALDKTLFGTKSLKLSIEEDGYEGFEGCFDFGDELASTALCFEVAGAGISAAVYDGALIGANEDKTEYVTGDIAKVASASESELDSLLVTLTQHSADEWVEELKKFGIEISAAKVLGWASDIVDGRLNEDVIAEIFDAVAIPYAVAIVNSYGFEIEESDIPDFKTLKEIIYGFFLEGHASSALEITENGGEYEVVVYFRAFAENVVEYISNHEKLQNLVNSELGQYFLKLLTAEIEYISEEESFAFTVELTDGFISKIEFYNIEIELSDFNEFTEIKEDYKKLKDETAEATLAYSVNSLSDLAELY